MKKVILLSLLFVFSLTTYAQITAADSTHLDSVLVLWNAKKRAEAISKYVYIDYSDSLLCPTKKNGVTNLQKFWISNASENEYILSYDKTEKALRVDFSFTKVDPWYQTYGNFNSFGFNLVKAILNSSSQSFNPFTQNDSVIGTFVDMSRRQNITITYKTQNLAADANISLLLMDANGRSSNESESVETISNGDSLFYTTRTFLWNNQNNQISDLFSPNWWGIDNGRSSVNNKPIGLPTINGNNLFWQLGDKVPLDLATICGWGITLNSGNAQPSSDNVFTLYIKSIQMGDTTQPKLDFNNFGFSQIPNVNFNATKTSETINLNKFLPIPGDKSHAELQQNTNLDVSVTNGIAKITQIKPCNSFSENIIFVSSLNGKIARTTITVTQNDVIATPFTFNQIPNQSSGGSIAFSNISLNQYVNGAKSSQIINFTVQKTEPACTFIVNTSKELVATIIDPTWMGTAIATISAQDQCGLTASTSVLYKQNGASLTTFAEPANGTFALSSEMVQRYETVQLFPSLTSASSVNWVFEGGTPSTSAYLSPTVKYAKPGTYKITLNAINNQGTTKIEKTIKVIGIEQKKTQTCANKACTFTLNDNSMQYAWSNGTTTQSITITPSMATLYVVTATKNSKSFIDTLEIKQVQTVYNEELKLATISENGKNVVLAWERTDKKGTAKYSLWREGLTNKYSKIGQLPFDSISVFVDSLADINKRAYKYKMTTTDTCGMESDLNNSIAQKTIHLQKTFINNELQLKWTLYEGADILGYKVLEGANYTQMHEVDSFATDQTTYTVSNPGINKYRVVSIFTDTISPSSLKSDSGPFSQSMSNMAESELTESNEISQEMAIVALPNPANGTFTCLVKNNSKADILLQLIDNIGIIVYSKVFLNTTWIEQKITIPTGSYFLKVSSGSSVKTIPLISF